jgi:hypothetical protein
MQQETLRDLIIEREIKTQGVVYELYGTGYVMHSVNNNYISRIDDLMYYGNSIDETVQLLLGYNSVIGFLLGNFHVYSHLQKIGKFSPSSKNTKKYTLADREMHVFWGKQPELSEFGKQFTRRYPNLMPLTTVPHSLGRLDYVVQIKELFAHVYESAVFRPEGGIISVEGSNVLTIQGLDAPIIIDKQPDRSRYGLLSKNNFYLADNTFFEKLEKLAIKKD